LIPVYRYRAKSPNGLLNQQSRVVNYVWTVCNGTQKHALKWSKKWPTGFDFNVLDVYDKIERPDRRAIIKTCDIARFQFSLEFCTLHRLCKQTYAKRLQHGERFRTRGCFQTTAARSEAHIEFRKNACFLDPGNRCGPARVSCDDARCVNLPQLI